MGLLEIINNYFFSIQFKDIQLSNETLQNLSQISQYHEIGRHYLIINKPLFPPYDSLIFSPYFQMIILILSLWTLQDIFDILIWPIIRPYRNKVKEWLKRSIKRSMTNLKKN